MPIASTIFLQSMILDIYLLFSIIIVITSIIIIIINIVIMISIIVITIINTIIINIINFSLLYLQYFTSSSIVIAAMDSISLLLSLSVLPHSIMLSLEGALLASKDFKFQSNSYLLMGILFVSYQV